MDSGGGKRRRGDQTNLEAKLAEGSKQERVVKHQGNISDKQLEISDKCGKAAGTEIQ